MCSLSSAAAAVSSLAPICTQSLGSETQPQELTPALPWLSFLGEPQTPSPRDAAAGLWGELWLLRAAGT